MALTVGLLNPLKLVTAGLGALNAIKLAPWLMRALGFGVADVAAGVGVTLLGGDTAQTPQTDQQKWDAEAIRSRFNNPSPHGTGPQSDPQSLEYVPEGDRPGLFRRTLDRFEGYGPGYGGGWNNPKVSTAEQRERSDDAIDYLVSKGWSREAAAGAAGNLQVESGFDTRAEGDNGKAHGLMQWHWDRQKQIEDHFHKRLGEMSYHEQLDAVDWETRTFGVDSLDRMNHSTAAGAGFIFAHELERPKDDIHNDVAEGRGVYADQALRQYQANHIHAPAILPPVPAKTAATPAAATDPHSEPDGPPAPSGRVDVHVHTHHDGTTTTSARATGRGVNVVHHTGEVIDTKYRGF